MVLVIRIIEELQKIYSRKTKLPLEITMRERCSVLLFKHYDYYIINETFSGYYIPLSRQNAGKDRSSNTSFFYFLVFQHSDWIGMYTGKFAIESLKHFLRYWIFFVKCLCLTERRQYSNIFIQQQKPMNFCILYQCQIIVTQTVLCISHY